MPTPATLEYIADIVVRRALADAAALGRPVPEVLAELYPFSNEDGCDHIWRAVLARHGIEARLPKKQPAGERSA